MKEFALQLMGICETCNYASLIQQTHSTLATFDSSLGTWYPTERPKKGKPVVAVDFTQIESLLENSAVKDDKGMRIPDLGYILYLKSNLDFSKADILSIICGVASGGIPNSVVLEFARNDHKEIISLLRRLVSIWKPKTACIQNRKLEVMVEYQFQLNDAAQDWYCDDLGYWRGELKLS